MVIFFIVYYFILIAIGIALFGGAFWVTWQIPGVLSGLESFDFRLFIVAIVAFLAMWWFCIQIGWFLVKPLFVVKKNKREGLLEIQPDNHQELFEIVKDVARATGNKMPKHVFLSSEVNAYVFYNSTSLWSIFFPSRKNLTIGIGLIRGLSKTEVKAIISHEFGHFSQKTMRVGSITFRLLKTVREMVEYAQKRQSDDAMARVSSDYRWYFHLEVWPIALITKSVISFYNWIDRKEKRLSRNMEFEADAVACSIVGNRAMISSLCKLETISERYASYENAVFHLLQNGFYPNDFWNGYLFYDGLLSENDTFSISYSDEFLSPATAEVLPPSLIDFSVSNEYNTHPSIEERIANAKEQSAVVSHAQKEDASLLVPTDYLNETGILKMKRMANHLCEQNGDNSSLWDNLSEIGMEKYKEWLGTFFHKRFAPRYISPFIDREVTNFPKPQINENEEVSFPFTDEYRKMLLFYLQGIRDWNILMSIRNNGNNTVFRYDKQNYSNAEDVLKIHQEYLDSFTPRLQSLDENIYKFLWHKAKDKERLETLYWVMLYSARCMHDLGELKQYTNQIYAQFDYFRQNGKDVSVKDSVVAQIEKEFKFFLNNFDFDSIDSMIGHWVDSNNVSVHKHLEEMKEFLGDTNIVPSIVKVNHLLDDVWAILERLQNCSKDEWRQRTIAAYKGEEYDAKNAESEELIFQYVEVKKTEENEKEEKSIEEEEERNERRDNEDCLNTKCLQCNHYTEKILNTESQIAIGIDALAPGIGVQNVIGWCSLDDTPIEDDMTECPSFCKKASISENNSVPKNEHIVEYPTSTDIVDLDKDVIKVLVLEAREKLYKERIDPDIIVEDLMQRELTEREAKIIVNKAMRR